MATNASGDVYITGCTPRASMIVGSDTISNPYGLTDSLEDMFLIRMDTSGNVLWTRWISNNVGVSVAIDPVGSIYVACLYTSVKKYDPAGDAIWDVPISNYPILTNTVTGVSTDMYGHVYMSGVFFIDTLHVGSVSVLHDSPPGGGWFDDFVVQLDTAGNAHWGHDVGAYYINSFPTLTTCDQSGNVYVDGTYFYGPTIIGADTLPALGALNASLIKYDSTGLPQWARGITNTTAQSLVCDADGFIYIANYNPYLTPDPIYPTPPYPNWRRAIMKYDACGNEVYAVPIDSTGAAPQVTNLSVSQSYDLYVTGYYKDSGLLAGTIVYDSSSFYQNTFVARWRMQSPIYTCAELSVQEPFKQATDVVLYPNPATSTLTITSCEPIKSISITNLVGQTVYSRALNNNKVEIDVSVFSAGIYFARINGGVVRRFVKE